MHGQSKSASATPARPADPFRILVVDEEPTVLNVLREAASGPHMTLLHARTIAQAKAQLSSDQIDLVLIEPRVADGQGLALAEDINRNRPDTRTIVISGEPNLQQAIDALRCGAADFIVKPLDLEEVNERVRRAMSIRKDNADLRQRLRRLRRICKKLNQARIQVTQQVDVLCNDLVTAYQELAGQMQQVVVASEFGASIRGELDLEELLRKTLEFVLAKTGPTNAAIFLPSQDQEYTVGAYVNYDMAPDAAEVLLQHLADVVAPRIADRDTPMHVTDNDALQHWIGDDAAYLADCHVLAFACRDDEEPLAVVVAFRDGSQPFGGEYVQAAGALGQMLGETLSRIIRIHHRHLPEPFETEEDGLEAA